MKKILSIAVSAAMLLPNIAAFGASNSKAEQILRSVKERIGSTDKYDRFDSSQSEYDGKVRYEFDWSTSKPDDYSSMSVSASDSGIILNLYVYDNGDDEDGRVGLSKLSSDEALKKAESHVNALNPGISDKLVLEKHSNVESLYSNDYSFNIKHIENGIPVSGDSGYVRYDANKDRLSSFSLSYTEAPELDSIENAVSPDEAQKGFMENIGLTLTYRKIYDDNGKSSFIPVYVPNVKPNQYINANTNAIEEIRVPSSMHTMFDRGEAADNSGGAGSAQKNAALTPVEATEIEAVNGLMSKDELIRLVKSNKYISVSSDYKLESYRLTGDRDSGDYFAQINFAADGENRHNWLSFTVNAKTGEMTNCWRSEEINKNAKLNEAAAARLADEVAKAFVGEKFSEYRIDENADNAKDGLYSYTRYVNDIPVESDTVSITIGADNKLSSFGSSYSENEFPSAEGVIDEAAAGRALFENVAYTMVYMPQTKSEKSTDFDIYVPVYVLDGEKPWTIDAFSGKLLDADGEEYVEFSLPEYSDLSGHYAESAVSELAKYGISFEGGTFRPDEKITQSDFIMLLTSAFDGGFSPYMSARRMRILKDDEVNPDAEVTRETAAVYLIRALGIEEYAALDGIFIKPYADVTSNCGAIAILSAMGVFHGDENGMFNPNAPISRADSAMIIYNYLSR